MKETGTGGEQESGTGNEAAGTEWARVAEQQSLLRACRARIAGPAVPGRRGKGMRQEDVAGLSGLSLRWYRQLEGAKGMAPPRLIDKVAAVLRMSPAERSLLHVLAAGADPPRPVTARDAAPPAGPGAALRHLADTIAPYPAGYTDATWSLLYGNEAMTDWTGGWLGPGGPCRHLICYLFSGHAATVLAGVGEYRQIAIAAMRYQYGRNLSASGWAQVIRCVTSVPEAAQLWDRHEVAFMPKEHPCQVILPGSGTARASAVFTPIRPDLWLYALVLPPGGEQAA